MLDIETLEGMAEAREISRGCEFCSAEGLATIFHVDYDGGCPYVTDFDPRGYPRRRLTRTVAYCVCPAGRTMMFEHQKHSKDLFTRITDLEDIILWKRSGCLWSTHDPNARERPDSPRTWKEAATLATVAAAAIITRVYPQADADRERARREMGIDPPQENAA